MVIFLFNFFNSLLYLLCFVTQLVKNLPAVQETQVRSLGQGRFPWRKKWQCTPVFLLGKSHGHRSLVGGSQWGRKESGTTEQLTLITSNRPSLLSEVKQYITLHVLKSRTILPFNPRKGVLKGARRCGLTAVRGLTFLRRLYSSSRGSFTFK